MRIIINNLEIFSPILKGWRLYLFLGFAAIISLAAFLVQRAIYRTIKRLESRHINLMIVPSLILFYIMTPLELMTLIAKSLHYPLSHITGSYFCYFSDYLHLWLNIFSHFITFFTTVFRYICLYHDEKLMKWKLSPKVRKYFMQRYTYYYSNSKTFFRSWLRFCVASIFSQALFWLSIFSFGVLTRGQWMFAWEIMKDISIMSLEIQFVQLETGNPSVYAHF